MLRNNAPQHDQGKRCCVFCVPVSSTARRSQLVIARASCDLGVYSCWILKTVRVLIPGHTLLCAIRVTRDQNCDCLSNSAQIQTLIGGGGINDGGPNQTPVGTYRRSCVHMSSNKSEFLHLQNINFYTMNILKCCMINVNTLFEKPPLWKTH